MDTLSQRQTREIKKCRDVRYWLKNYVVTKDEHDKLMPFKPFPYYFEGLTCDQCGTTSFKAEGISESFCVWCEQMDWSERAEKYPKHKEILDRIDSDIPRYGFPYLAIATDAFIRNQFLLIPKSRQIRMSWLAVALFLHDALFTKGRNIIFQSEKEFKAHRLLERARVIWSRLPEWMRLPESGDRGKIEFLDNDSQIFGVPQGKSQVESETLSGLFSDEVVEQIDANESFNRAFPALSNPTPGMGGKYLGVSKAGSGFFYAACFDKISNPEGTEEVLM